MPERSLSTESSFDCPECGATMPVRAWMVIDGTERPDLIVRLIDDTLHDVACVNCEFRGSVSGSILVRRGDRPSELLFAPLADLVEDQMGTHVGHLVTRLMESTGLPEEETGRWQITLVPHRLLRRVLSTTAEETDALLLEYRRDLHERIDQAADAFDFDGELALWDELILTTNPLRERAAQIQSRIARLLINGGGATGDRADRIERAIHALRKCLDFYKPDTHRLEWGQATMLLGLALTLRDFGHEKCDNADGLKLLREAAAFLDSATEHDAWAEANTFLARQILYSHIHDPARNRRESIEICRRIIADGNATETSIAAAQLLLATALSYRASDATAADFDEAIALITALLEDDPDEDPGDDEVPAWAEAKILSVLASAHYYYPGDPPEHVEAAIPLYRRLIELYRACGDPSGLESSAGTLGNALYDLRQWAAACEAYAITFDVFERSFASASLLDTQAIFFGHMGEYQLRRYAQALVATGRSVDAVRLLDRWKARDLTRVAAAEELIAAGASVAPYDVHAYVTATRRLYEIERSLASLDVKHARTADMREVRERRHDARMQLAMRARAEADIRAALDRSLESGYGNAIARAAAMKPLVYISHAKFGGDAFIVTPNRPVVHVPLPDAADGAVTAQCYGLDPTYGVEGLLGAYMNAVNHADDEEMAQTWRGAVEETLEWAGQAVMAPVVAALQRMAIDECVLIPCGLLSILPLHAARIGERHVLDLLSLSYAPNATAVVRSARRELPARPTLLAVEVPGSGARRLTYSRIETRAALLFAGSGRLLAEADATRENVLAVLPEHPITHFSAHGRAYESEPLRSSIQLHDGPLTMLDMATQYGKASAVAVLSACEAAMPGLHAAEQSLGLPIAFLRAGYGSVVAPLWIVDDLMSMLLMTRFYDSWLGSGFPPPRALRRAQLWLRDSTVQEKREYLARILALLRAVRLVTELDTLDIGAELYRLDNALHPIHWAPFAVTGL